MVRDWVRLTLLASVAVLAAAGPAGAATFSVNSSEDRADVLPGDGACATLAGTCTLRAAVQETNLLLGADAILVPSGTYRLGICCGNLNLGAALGQLTLLDDVTISGAGARKTLVTSSALPLGSRVFSSPRLSVRAALSGLTMSGGTSLGDAGGIWNAGTMTLSGVTVRENSASGSGGAIATAGALTITDSTIAANWAGATGGGIAVLGGGSLSAANTTISGNRVTAGGLLAQLLGNGVGGAIASASRAVTLSHVTVAANQTFDRGRGAIAGPATLSNTILANGPLTGNCIVTAAGAPRSKGHNLADDASCKLTAPGDRDATDARLQSLTDNGGQSDTHALSSGSAAVDAGDPAGCPSTDERGAPRPLGGGCDIGAFERLPVADLSVQVTASPNPVPVDGNLTYTVVVRNSGPDPAYGVLVSQDLPVDSTLVSLAPNCSVGGRTVTCELGVISVGGSVSTSLVVRAGGGVAATSVARVSSSSADPVSQGNFARAATTILARLFGGQRRLPPPVRGRTVDVAPVRGTVLIRRPGERRFTRLAGEQEIPVGSTIDARRGRVRLTTTRDAKGTMQTADFFGGAFVVSQKPAEALTRLRLVGGSFRACPRTAARAATAAVARRPRADGPVAGAARRARRAAKKKSDKKSNQRQLWGSGHGRFRTEGRYGSATVRGTIWFTQDRCAGTYVKVRRGVVAVRDRVRKRTKLVRAGSSYLVRAPR